MYTMYSMSVFSIFHHYLLWHYSQALRELTHVSGNLLWFIFHFFSIPQLTRSLFSPYRRITEERHQAFNFEDIAGYLIINLTSRVIGFLMRLTIISLGLITLLILLFGIVLTYLFWFTAPIALLTFLLAGFGLLIT